MPDIIVTIHADWLTIDGELPEGYRLIVHNHSGDPDHYAYTREINNCQYPAPAESIDGESREGVQCFEYTEP